MLLLLADKGIVAQHLSQRGSSLPQEMKQFSFYGRVCAMKGFLQALPKAVLCSRLHMLPAGSTSATHHASSSSSAWKHNQSDSSAPDLSCVSLEAHTAETDGTASSSSANRSKDSTAADKASHAYRTDMQHGHAAEDLAAHTHHTHESNSEKHSRQEHPNVVQSTSQHLAGTAWMLLSDGALPACCAAVQQSTDAHHKFHAVSALAFCLERIKQCLQVRSTLQAVPVPVALRVHTYNSIADICTAHCPPLKRLS